MKVHLLIGLLFFSGMLTLSRATNGLFGDYPLSEHNPFIERNMSEFVREVETKYGIRCYGKGGAFMDGVKKVDLSFLVFGPMSLEDLRLQLLILTEEYLYKINNDSIVYPYLKNYPFTADNLSFSIRLIDQKGKTIENKGSEQELLSSVSLIKGDLYYFFSNDEKVCLQDAYEEPYEEALSIVRKQYPDRFPVYTYPPMD